MTRWTRADIGDLTGKTAIVTGSNSGLGYETALALVRHGADVIVACRHPARGAHAVDQLRAASAGTGVGPVPGSARLGVVDLADLASVRAFAASWREPGMSLDLLVNNAGVMALPHQRTADGFEMQFGTNHLGHFALTALLLPALHAAPAPRVVTVSSIMHVIGTIDFDDLQHERRYSKWMAYGQAKLANLMFALELDRRAKMAGSPLLSTAAHPGYASTNLQGAGPLAAGRSFQARSYEVANRIFAQSAAAGALPALFAATSPTVEGGEYFGPGGLGGLRGHPAPARPSNRALDSATAARLWSVSEELTGVTFDLATA